MDYYVIDNELYHYGVKGMKWGVRRYQNKDGSLTEEGKKRLSENAGWYLNPRQKSKSGRDIKNRAAVSKEYQDAYWNLMKKHGLDQYDGDGAELSWELTKKGKHQADDKLWNSYIDRYASATLKDLKMKESTEARSYVKGLFEKDLIEIENQPSIRRIESIEERKTRLQEKQKLKDRIWAAEAEAVSIRDSIKSAIDSRNYKSKDEKTKAVDAAYRKAMDMAQKNGNTLLENEIWQQWNFSYDDHDWD